MPPFFFSLSSGRRGLTLMEVTVTVSLVALMGMTVFSALNNGLNLWKSANAALPRADAAVFFEKATQEFENVYDLDRVTFQGDNVTVVFPSSVKELRRDGQWSMAAVCYAFDDKARVLTRSVATISDVFEGRSPEASVVLDHVSGGLFAYYFFDPQTREYVWSDKWPPELAQGAASPAWPMAVKMQFRQEKDGRTYDFEDVFPIPVAQP